MDPNSSIPKTVKLSNGIEMPTMGMGTYAIPDIDKVVYNSIKNGVRMLDTAWFYKNEKEVGLGVNQAIADGIIKREDIYVITKVWYTRKHEPEASLRESLANLNLDYVDLLLDHWPFTLNVVDGVEIKTPIHTFWGNMESLVEKGLTKSIGVSNYNVQSLMEIFSFCKIAPVVNEVELHPYLWQRGLIDYCNKKNVRLIAFNSLCRGKYTSLFHNKEVNLNLLEEDVVKEVAKKVDKSAGQVALNWALSQGITVIPSSSKPERMTENMNSVLFRLSQEDIDKIGALDKGYRFCPSTIQPGVDYDVFA